MDMAGAICFPAVAPARAWTSLSDDFGGLWTFPRFWMDDPCLPAEVRNYSQVLLTSENLTQSSSTRSGPYAKLTYD